MKRAQLEVKDFSSGIISDASPVATPEGVVLRSCNFDIQPNGSARLRPPLRREGGALFSAASGDSRVFVWDAPDGDTSKQFLIAQTGSTFLVLRRARTVDAAVTNVTPSTATHSRNALPDATVGGVVTVSSVSAKIDVAVSGRYAIVTGVVLTTEVEAYHEAVLILEYDRDAGTLSAKFDHIWVRDFFGLDDLNTSGTRTSLDVDNNEIMYNLFNQGWGSTVSPGALLAGLDTSAITAFYLSAQAPDSDAICTLQTPAAGTDVAINVDGVLAYSGSWQGSPQNLILHATNAGGAGTCTVKVTGKNWQGATKTYTKVFTFAGAGGQDHITTYQFTSVTAVTVTNATGLYSVKIGTGKQLPSKKENWTLGVYPDTSTTRSFNVNFILQAPDGASVSPKGRYTIPITYRSLLTGAGSLSRQVYKNSVAGVWSATLSAEGLSSWTDTSLPDDRTGRPHKVCYSVGRAWYAFTRNLCSSESQHAMSPDIGTYVCFSRIIETPDDCTTCYSANDPTSPELNDILADDGGFVKIPGAGEIKALRESQNGVLVIAENGVWQIAGELDKGFTATAYQAIRLTDQGCVAEDSVIQAQNSVVYVSKDGIEVASPAEGGLHGVQSLTKDKNDTLFRSIADITTIKGGYDSSYREVKLLYTISGAYTGEIVIDMGTGAITTRKFVPGSYAIKGLVQYPTPRVAYFSDGTVCPNCGYLLNNGTNSYLGYLRYDDDAGVTYTWQDEGGSYASSSEVFVGHVSLGDLASKKTVTYLEMFFERTEDTYTVVSGDVTVNHQSGCYVDSYWEWADTATSQYKGQQFQAYWYRRPYLAASADGTYTYDYGQSVIWTKTKLRGNGKTLALKITPESGKDCRVLGWCYTVGAHYV